MYVCSWRVWWHTCFADIVIVIDSETCHTRTFWSYLLEAGASLHWCGRPKSTRHLFFVVFFSKNMLWDALEYLQQLWHDWNPLICIRQRPDLALSRSPVPNQHGQNEASARLYHMTFASWAPFSVRNLLPRHPSPSPSSSSPSSSSSSSSSSSVIIIIIHHHYPSSPSSSSSSSTVRHHHHQHHHCPPPFGLHSVLSSASLLCHLLAFCPCTSSHAPIHPSPHPPRPHHLDHHRIMWTCSAGWTELMLLFWAGSRRSRSEMKIAYYTSWSLLIRMTAWLKDWYLDGTK